MNTPESAFIVPVPEAEMSVGPFRARFDPVAALGVPAHITVLYPFMNRALIDGSLLSAVQALLGEIPSFAFRLDRIDCFPGVLYLAPAPAAPLVSLTNALAAQFPAYPPYAGRFERVVPHLTVAHGTDEQLAAIQNELADTLRAADTIRSVCHSVLLIENSSGVWSPMHTFRLRPTTFGPEAAE
jgi:2'-5' RNA ligase